MKPLKSTKPLNLPTLDPPCFGSQSRWDLYRAAAVYSAGDGHTFCTDCTPAYKAAMQAQGRCRHNEIVFVINGGSKVGRRVVQ